MNKKTIRIPGLGVIHTPKPGVNPGLGVYPRMRNAATFLLQFTEHNKLLTMHIHNEKKTMIIK